MTIPLEVECARDTDNSGTEDRDSARSQNAAIGERLRSFSHVRIVAAFPASSHHKLRISIPVQGSCTQEYEPIYVRVPTGGQCRIQNP